jgi:hypothetical protein
MRSIRRSIGLIPASHGRGTQSCCIQRQRKPTVRLLSSTIRHRRVQPKGCGERRTRSKNTSGSFRALSFAALDPNTEWADRRIRVREAGGWLGPCLTALISSISLATMVRTLFEAATSNANLSVVLGESVHLTFLGYNRLNENPAPNHPDDVVAPARAVRSP